MKTGDVMMLSMRAHVGLPQPLNFPIKKIVRKRAQTQENNVSTPVGKLPSQDSNGRSGDARPALG